MGCIICIKPVTTYQGRKRIVLAKYPIIYRCYPDTILMFFPGLHRLSTGDNGSILFNRLINDRFFFCTTIYRHYFLPILSRQYINHISGTSHFCSIINPSKRMLLCSDLFPFCICFYIIFHLLFLFSLI